METETSNCLPQSSGLLFLLATFIVLAICSCTAPMDFPLVNPCDPLYQGDLACPYYQINDTGQLTTDADLDVAMADDTGLDSGFTPQDTDVPQPSCRDDNTGNPKPGWCLINDQCFRVDTPNPTNPCQQCSPGHSNQEWSNTPTGTLCTLEDDQEAAQADGEGTEGACQEGNCVPIVQVCACTGQSICCDGCNPINEGTECFYDSLSCTEYLCGQEGSCDMTLIAGWCLDEGNTCRDTNTDPAHCGSCGHSCLEGQLCQGGNCIEDCGDVLTLCGQTCVDLQTDSKHCGRCLAPCQEGRACLNGACSTQCATGLTLCGETACVDTNTNPSHCGQCFMVCGQNEICNTGQCIRKVTSITISPDTLAIGVGQTATLQAVIEPPNATDTTVTWFSANPDKASVNEDGLVTGKSLGLALIRATTRDGGHMAYANVTVSYRVTGVTIDKEFLQLTVGGQTTLNATVLPPNAEIKQITWSSDQPSVAEVDKWGTITARSSGQATITVTTVDGGFTAQCQVTISEVPVTGISLTPTSVIMSRSQTRRLQAALHPSNATIRSIFWSSSDPDVATIDQYGTIYGLDAGHATITAQSQDGGFTATCAVTVMVITLLPNPLHIPILESTGQFTPVFNPPDAIDHTVSWSSANTAIASVDSQGIVTGHLMGETEVTATALDGGHMGVAQVMVGIRATGVSLSPPLLKLAPTETGNFTPAVRPPDATNQAVTWQSDNPQVATIDPTTGLITANTVGNALITATTMDRGHIGSATLVVRILVDTVTITPSTHTISVGETVPLTATLMPIDATDKGITWSSSAPQIATVSSNGLVSGISAGSVTITATSTDDGAQQGTATITILPLVSSVSLNKASLAIPLGDTVTLVATVIPEAAADKRVEWTSSNRNVATVSQGGAITTVGLGTTTIQVRTMQGGYTASCTVTVIPFAGSGIYNDPYRTAVNLRGSCLEYKQYHSPAQSSYYSIYRNYQNITVYCDMTTDGGGYTFLKVALGYNYSAQNAESYCSAWGMRLFIPRTEAHYQSAQYIARNIYPGNNINYLSIMGIYPNYNGAKCMNTPLRSDNQSCAWRAGDNRRFWVSNRTDITEPNGDNSTSSSMRYDYNAYGLTWYNDTNSPGNVSYMFICDTADKY